MKTGAAVVAALRAVVTTTFVKPIRQGRPRPSSWPKGLVAVGVATAVLYGWLALFAALAQPLRAADTLVVSYTNGVTVPSLAVPLLLGGLVWSMVLVHAAALHTTWWARLALALVSFVAVALFGAQTWGDSWLLGLSIASYVALWGFILIRSRRSYAWWEFPVVALWLVIVLYGPWLRPGYGAVFGVDHRLTAIQGALGSLGVLSVPALLAAGCAPALITVTAGGSLASRSFPRGLAVVAISGLVIWRIVDVTLGLRSGDAALSWRNLLAATLTLVAVLVIASILRRRSTRATLPGPGALPEIWSAYVWPLSMALGWVVFLTAPFAVVSALSSGTAFGRAVVDPFWRWFQLYGPQLVRVLIGLGAFVVAWRLVARRQLAGAVLLTAFFAYTVVQRIGPLTGVALIGSPTAEALAAVSSLVAVGVLAWGCLSRRLSRRRLVGLSTVLILGAVFPHRSILDDPISALVGFAGLAVLLFGLGWQLLTNADYTNDATQNFPRSTRVLLYLANALFALTGAAFLALSRESGAIDATDWTELGDDMLGVPLLVGTIVVSLWSAIGAEVQPEGSVEAVTENLTD